MRRANLEQTFTALSDPARLAVVELLRERPLRSSELARELWLNRPLMSKHLQVLRRAGLVEERALVGDARARVYQLRPAAFAELRGWLDEVEAFWTDQLQAFKVHAERRAGEDASASPAQRARVPAAHVMARSRRKKHAARSRRKERAQ